MTLIKHRYQFRIHIIFVIVNSRPGEDCQFVRGQTYKEEEEEKRPILI
jgi:hypothetical protein